MNIILDRPGVTDAERELRAGLVARSAELVPVLQANANWTADDRRVAEENIRAIEDAGLFRIMQPRRFGGLETDFRTKLEVTRELARGCGSTAWTTSLINVCAWFAGMWNERAQDDVWKANPGNRIAGVLAPTGTAEPVDDGYRSPDGGNGAPAACMPSGRFSASRSLATASCPTRASSWSPCPS